MQATALFQLMSDDGGTVGVDLFNYIQKETRKVVVSEAIKQYEPSLHDVASKSKRPDKKIFVPTGEIDPQTNKPVIVAGTAPVSRAPISFQKYIISQKGSFARGNGVILKPTVEGTKTFDRVYSNWQDNKTNFDLKDIAVSQMGETQVAVIFYGEKGAETFDDFKFRYKIVSPLKGDKLIPFFDDDTDDLIGFGREYMRGKKTMYDFYTMSPSGLAEIWRYENRKPKIIAVNIEKDGVIVEVEQHEVIKTQYTKLPIVYWEQPTGECNDTDALIKEFETGFSDFLTQMGYSADPILFAKGTAMDMPTKGSAGKFIESTDPAADLKYVTPDNATEARELQFRMLKQFIFSLNRAVMLDLETLKGLGATSGAALERYLIDVYAEATDKQQGSWGKGVQRMVNWLTSQWQNLEGTEAKGFRIDVVFTKYSLQDEAERVDIAVKANGNKAVVDLESGVAMAGLVDDIKGVTENIKKETAVQTVVPIKEPLTE